MSVAARKGMNSLPTIVNVRMMMSGWSMNAKGIGTRVTKRSATRYGVLVTDVSRSRSCDGLRSAWESAQH